VKWDVDKFIDIVDNIRISNGLNKAAFGRKIGIRDPITVWKNRRGTVGIKTLITICNEFDVTLDYLIRGKEAENKNEDTRTPDYNCLIEINALQKQIIKQHQEIQNLKANNKKTPPRL